MDTLIILAGSLVGQIAHIVKKRTEGKEESESEWAVIRKWVFARPINTLAATIVGWSVTTGMVTGMEGSMASTAGAPQITQGWMFLQAILTGIAANSAVNRPGQ